MYVDVVSVLCGGLCDLCFCVVDNKMKKIENFDLAEGREGCSNSRREKKSLQILRLKPLTITWSLYTLKHQLRTAHHYTLFQSIQSVTT